ncbi:MAG: glycosyltransferase family 4 protein [Planctomycetota bacterium]
MARVCMVVYSTYPADPRVRREAEALAEEGASVDVVCLRGGGERGLEDVRGVRVVRLPVGRSRGGRLRYVWEWGLFIVMSFVVVSWLHLVRRYHVIHVHNMPDFLVASALVPRFSGARLVLDLHDPTPEVFMTKYGIGAEHPLTRALAFLERCSIRVAHLVLTPNEAFRRLFIARGCPEGKIAIVMNSPQESVFALAEGAKARGGPSPRGRPGHVLMYHGTIVERHGLGTALEAVARLRRDVPEIEFRVFGDGDWVDEFKGRVRELGLEDRVRFHGRVPLERIASEIPSADAGVVPNRRTPFTEINLPTRIFEYLAMGRPVVAPRTRGVLDYFGEGDLFLFEPGDAGDLADAMRRALFPSRMRTSVLARGREAYLRHRWAVERGRLVRLYEQLLGVGGAAAPPTPVEAREPLAVPGRPERRAA